MSSPSELVRLASQAQVFDLSQTAHSAMPQPPWHAVRYSLTLLRRHGDKPRPGGLDSANDFLISLVHSGTHIDGLTHMSVHGKLFGGVVTDDVQRGPDGMSQLGIETAPLFVRRGVLLDVARLNGSDGRMGATESVGAEALDRCLSTANAEIHDGDAVFIRTGWGALWDDPERYLNASEGVPGVGADGAEWLSAHGAALVGIDTMMFDRFDPTNLTSLPAHIHLIVEKGIYLAENVNLEELSKNRIVEFLLVLLPLKLKGATGSPVRPIALV